MATQPSHELNKQPSCFVEGNQPGRPIKTIKDTDQLSCSVRRRRKSNQPISLKNQSPYFVNMPTDAPNQASIQRANLFSKRQPGTVFITVPLTVLTVVTLNNNNNRQILIQYNVHFLNCIIICWEEKTHLRVGKLLLLKVKLENLPRASRGVPVLGKILK